ncbi:MAG: Oligopeptide ABC transporter, periplasmic oligopeptide-binding protein OppA, partial [uncultured Thermomicrobiales bacterium]
ARLDPTPDTPGVRRCPDRGGADRRPGADGAGRGDGRPGPGRAGPVRVGERRRDADPVPGLDRRAGRSGAVEPALRHADLEGRRGDHPLAGAGVGGERRRPRLHLPARGRRNLARWPAVDRRGCRLLVRVLRPASLHLDDDGGGRIGRGGRVRHGAGHAEAALRGVPRRDRRDRADRPAPRLGIGRGPDRLRRAGSLDRVGPVRAGRARPDPGRLPLGRQRGLLARPTAGAGMAATHGTGRIPGAGRAAGRGGRLVRHRRLGAGGAVRGRPAGGVRDGAALDRPAGDQHGAGAARPGGGAAGDRVRAGPPPDRRNDHPSAGDCRRRRRRATGNALVQPVAAAIRVRPGPGAGPAGRPAPHHRSDRRRGRPGTGSDAADARGGRDHLEGPAGGRGDPGPTAERGRLPTGADVPYRRRRRPRLPPPVVRRRGGERVRPGLHLSQRRVHRARRGPGGHPGRGAAARDRVPDAGDPGRGVADHRALPPPFLLGLRSQRFHADGDLGRADERGAVPEQQARARGDL